jgi:hypothetical protein
MSAQQPADARIWLEPDGPVHIDVRGLPAPQPMVQILQLVARLRDDEVLVVHHERDPLGLYPELLQIGWWADIVPGDPGEVRLLLARAR